MCVNHLFILSINRFLINFRIISILIILKLNKNLYMQIMNKLATYIRSDQIPFYYHLQVVFISEIQIFFKTQNILFNNSTKENRRLPLAKFLSSNFVKDAFGRRKRFYETKTPFYMHCSEFFFIFLNLNFCAIGKNTEKNAPSE